jgi:hypothetical protein
MSSMAYIRNLPCLNPSCHSHGTPHPNCRCYGFAKGGEAENYFCAANRAHEASCQYFMAGGQASLTPAETFDPRGIQGPQTGFKEGGSVLPFHPLLNDPGHATASAIAHGGAGMLFGDPKSPYFGAFGSGDTASARLASQESGPLGANINNYLGKVKRGSKAIESNVKSLFDGGPLSIPEASDKVKDQIKDYVENGGITAEMQTQAQAPEGYAEGGLVDQEAGQEDPLSTMLPDHNILLNAAKARVANHLNSIRAPEFQVKLPFDSNKSTKLQDRTYDRAVDMAASPLKILHELKDGSLTPNQLKHFTTMYPELHTQLSKEMTKGVLQAQLDGTKPKYKVRQAMSMFLGSELDSSMTPANIMAAQNVFAMKNAGQQGAAPAPKQKKKGSTAPLSKVADNYQTSDQAAQARNKQ